MHGGGRAIERRSDQTNVIIMSVHVVSAETIIIVDIIVIIFIVVFIFVVVIAFSMIFGCVFVYVVVMEMVFMRQVIGILFISALITERPNILSISIFGE